MRRRSDEPGRIKEKLALLLQAQGYAVSEYELERVYGNKYNDLARWNGYEGQYHPDVTRIFFYSWDSMTDCVRYGITCTVHGPYEVEVHSNKGA